LGKQVGNIYVNPPIDIPTGEKQTFIVTAEIAGELIGGIEVEVVKNKNRINVHPHTQNRYSRRTCYNNWIFDTSLSRSKNSYHDS